MEKHSFTGTQTSEENDETARPLKRSYGKHLFNPV